MLVYLQYIDLSGNKIRSMNGLQQHPFLETINLEDNEVSESSQTKWRPTKLLNVLVFPK